ncbi:polysaccharide lyase family 1 protein [Cadophora sp. DSE1049]|nr:polysaccharide lyase family 1 protein [Cadophora sp. DSE1049]
MRSSIILAGFATFLSSCAAQKVVGSSMGFAKGTTGGGSATPAVPKDITQLKTWLSDSVARVIVIDKEFNFIGSEGTVSENGCRPASNKCPGNGGQDAINGANWYVIFFSCDGQPAVKVSYDKAGVSGLVVGSNKSIVGVGAKGVIRGKGLRMQSGVKNVIIQNIHITELNPQYIWGGDAIQTFGADLIWIDHVKISLIGRQMFAASSGGATSGRITISNTEFDGSTAWSASCNNKHYWTILLNGSKDSVTLFGNYIHHTSGRSPKVAGKATIVHAVNNSGYSPTYFFAYRLSEEGLWPTFDVTAPSQVVAEGNVFYRVKTSLLGKTGKLYTLPGSACKANLGHDCVANAVTESGAFSASDNILAAFKGYPTFVIGKATTNVRLTAGVGKI